MTVMNIVQRRTTYNTVEKTTTPIHNLVQRHFMLSGRYGNLPIHPRTVS